MRTGLLPAWAKAPTTLNAWQAPSKPLSWPLILLHTTCAFMVLSYIIPFFSLSSTVEHSPSSYTAPSSSLQPFTTRRTIESLHSNNASTQAWINLYRGIDGFLYVKKNRTDEKPMLSEGDGNGPSDADPWGISMFHGIHCLQMIRDRLVSALEGGMEEVMGAGEQGHSMTHDGHGDHTKRQENHEAHRDDAHVGHCFGYLAQSLLCSADTTIEPPHFTRDRNGRIIDLVVDGHAVAHQCKDMKSVFEVARKSQEEGVGQWLRDAWYTGATLHELLL